MVGAAARVTGKGGTLVGVSQTQGEFEAELFFAFALIAEAGQPELEDHLHHVADYTRWIGGLCVRRGLLAPDRAHLIAAASVVHDLGKVAVANEILLKLATLSRSERGYMQEHVPMGATLLERVLSRFDRWIRPAVAECAVEIAGTHHEWWDGSGYPGGLRGEQIPMAGRIVALADVLDALFSRRTYKRAWTDDEVRAHVAANQGAQFDPAIARIVLDHWDEKPAFVAARPVLVVGRVHPP